MMSSIVRTSSAASTCTLRPSPANCRARCTVVSKAASGKTPVISNEESKNYKAVSGHQTIFSMLHQSNSVFETEMGRRNYFFSHKYIPTFDVFSLGCVGILTLHERASHQHKCKPVPGHLLNREYDPASSPPHSPRLNA